MITLITVLLALLGKAYASRYPERYRLSGGPLRLVWSSRGGFLVRGGCQCGLGTCRKGDVA